MVAPLDKKLVRELWRMRAQVVTIALVVACGVAAYVGMASTFRALDGAARAFYQSARFADVWAPVRRAPRALEPRVRALAGVAGLDARIVKDVLLDMPGQSDPAIGHVVSLPRGRQPDVNRVHLRHGRLPDPTRAEEVVVSEPFAQAHHLAPGDRVTAVLNGRRERLRVVGVGLSPEFLVALRPGEFVPDDRRWGVLWMGQGAMETAWQLEGAVTEFALVLAPGAPERPVIAQLDRLLAPYGAPGAYPRERQPSGRFITQELAQLRSFATVAPAIFLAVAAFLVNIVLARTIAAQREQLAALKALGFTNWEIGAHYVKFVLVIVALGGAAGVGFGAWLGRVFIGLYGEVFRFPVLAFGLGGREVAIGLLISAGASVLGAVRVIARAVSLPPAEAMRPEAPPSYRPTLAERLGLHRFFSQAARMVLRDMERRPLRTLAAVLGIAFATSIVVVGRFSNDAIDYLIDVQFRRAQREDLTVALEHARPVRVRHELAALPGVLASEGARTIAVRLRSGHRMREVAITGLDPQSTLRRLYDTQGRRVALPGDGLMVSRTLGERLGLRAGDVVSAELLDGTNRVLRLPVAGLLDDFMGLSAYMQRAALHRALGEEPVFTEVLVRVDPARIDALYDRLKRAPAVAGVTRRDTLSRYFRERTASSALTTSLILGIIAAVIAVGVVYNSARIALAMRSRELASLRVLGFTRGEVAAILIGEQMAQVLAAIVPGLALGWLLSWAIAQTVDPELFRFPLVVAPRTYASAAVTVLLAGLASAWMVRRRSDRLDLIAVLKARD